MLPELSALFACGVLSSGLAAQQIPSVNQASSSITSSLNSDAATRYELKAGDEISIHVLDIEEISDRPLRIDRSGGVNLPLVGKIQAAGLTTVELQEAVSRRLQAFLKNPSVTITQTGDRDQPIAVLGAVNFPGIKQIHDTPKTLLEVISEAGGLKANAGPIVRLTRLKAEGAIPLPEAVLAAGGESSVAEIDLASLLGSQNSRENVRLRPHDIVAVPLAELIYILGEVSRPGGYEIVGSRTVSILNAVALAGGANRNGDSSRARVLRSRSGKLDRTEFVVDLNRQLSNKAGDFHLQPQDILYIPTNKGKVITNRALEAMIGTGSSITVFRGSR